MINTNDATKWKNYESSKFEQIEMDQTSNVDNEEIDDDNIPLNKFHKHCQTKHWRNKKKQKKDFVMKLFITLHNKDQ